MKPNGNEILVGLDMGTSKIRVVVCEAYRDGTMKIIGVGQAPCTGMVKGTVSNINLTVDAIKAAMHDAEMMSECTIDTVSIGITGAHIRSYNANGAVAIRDREIKSSDIDRVIEAARSVAISNDEKILHVIPQSYTIDEQDGVQNPIGMCGARLEAKVHVVTGNVNVVQNVIKCVELCNLKIESMTLDQISSAESVLTNDEKDLGVCLVDLGEGTTDVAVYHEGAIRRSTVIPIAGYQTTRDIAITLKTSTKSAEKVKRRYGNAHVKSVEENEYIEIPETEGRPQRSFTHQDLAEVIEPRIEEILFHIKSDLDRFGVMDSIGSGFVFTGGSAKMKGLLTLAEEIFESPTRIGLPTYASALSDIVHHPSFATVVGICQSGLKNLPSRPIEMEQNFEEEYEQEERTGLSRIFDYVKKVGTHSEDDKLEFEETRVRSGT